MKQHVVWLCNGCGHVFDDIQPEGGEAHWIESRAYLLNYGFQWDDLDFIHDTCPPCARRGGRRIEGGRHDHDEANTI